MNARKELTVECPKCKEKFSYYESKFRPFCSERCKEVDLGHWFSENYKVPSKENLSDSDLDRVLEEREKDSYGKDH